MMNDNPIRTLIVVVLAAGSSIGFMPGGYADEEKEILYWVAPMDPNNRRDKPGKSPMGMDLVPVYADKDAAAANIVSIEPVVVQNLGVRTTKAERSRLWRGIDTVG